MIDADRLKIVIEKNFGHGTVDPIYQLIDAAPTIEPKQSEWRWKFADNGWKDIYCLECGWTKNVDVHVSLNYDFCPGCGAKMR